MVRPIVLLKGDSHAQTADCSAGSHTAHRAGRYPENRHAGRAEHDLRAMPDHGQEVVGEGARCERRQSRFRQENGHRHL